MSREIPEVVRAAAGLAATVLDEARKLPETLPGLPVRILGIAMQQAMKVQQHYAGLVARGDELFTGLRGENEPGLATFDDEDDEPTPASAPSDFRKSGFRDSAFDRAGDTQAPSAGTDLITDEEDEELPADAVLDELAALAEEGELVEVLVEEAPGIEEVLDEIAIDEMVDQAPSLDETAPTTPELAVVVVDDAPAAEDADALESALPESTDTATDTATEAEPTADVSTTVDVLTPAGDVATVDAAVTDEGIAAPESAAPESPVADAPEEPATDAPVDALGEASAAPTEEPEGGSELSGSQAAGAAPVDGYDSFSIAQLRGRLRGYTLSTVSDLLAYEEATRAREPYLRMLRNRLEKLEEQAVDSSPLAPRGT